MYTYQYRNELNIEYLLVRDFFLKAKTITCVLYVTDKETYRVHTHEMEDFSKQIIETVEKSSLKAVSDINDRITSLETLM